MKFVLATSNEHKKEEFESYFKKYNIEILTLKDLNINVDVEETGSTFKENAYIKASTIAKLTPYVVIADDSGLQIHALNDFPGIYSARFMEGHTYEEKFVSINEKLQNISDRSACFNCTLCIMNLEKNPIYIEGKVEGTILESSKGKQGFGYDPIFYYEPLKKTFAELTKDEKNQVSHRGLAIKKIIEYLKECNYL